MSIPIGENKGDTDGSLQTGDGEFIQHVQVMQGTSLNFKGFPVYSKMDVGFNNRSKGFSDELIIGGETGVQLFKNKLLLLARIRWIHPLYNGSLDATNSNGSVFANNVACIESFLRVLSKSLVVYPVSIIFLINFDSLY